MHAMTAPEVLCVVPGMNLSKQCGLLCSIFKAIPIEDADQGGAGLKESLYSSFSPSLGGGFWRLSCFLSITQ
jgi:hypothetical protein